MYTGKLVYNDIAQTEKKYCYRQVIAIDSLHKINRNVTRPWRDIVIESIVIHKLHCILFNVMFCALILSQVFLTSFSHHFDLWYS